MTPLRRQRLEAFAAALIGLSLIYIAFNAVLALAYYIAEGMMR
jgi:energy-converting hydrogenase Eha subunit E